MFNSAKISNFAKAEKEKYFKDMTTKEDIQRMILFAEEKGEEKGIEKGIEKGLAQGLEQTAKAMLEKGYPVADIAAVTAMSPKAIEALRSI